MKNSTFFDQHTQCYPIRLRSGEYYFETLAAVNALEDGKDIKSSFEKILEKFIQTNKEKQILILQELLCVSWRFVGICYIKAYKKFYYEALNSVWAEYALLEQKKLLCWILSHRGLDGVEIEDLTAIYQESSVYQEAILEYQLTLDSKLPISKQVLKKLGDELAKNNNLVALADVSYKIIQAATEIHGGFSLKMCLDKLLEEFEQLIFSETMPTKEAISDMKIAEKMQNMLMQFYDEIYVLYEQTGFIGQSCKRFLGTIAEIEPHRCLTGDIKEITHSGGLRHVLQFLYDSGYKGYVSDDQNYRGIYVHHGTGITDARKIFYADKCRVFTDIPVLLTGKVPAEQLRKATNEGYEAILHSDAEISDVRITVLKTPSFPIDFKFIKYILPGICDAKVDEILETITISPPKAVCQFR